VIVIVLTACPAGLRGQLTRWLIEVAPGVFVGHVSPRVRGHLWARVCELTSTGRALMVHQDRSEQRLAFEVFQHDWVPTDFDGMTLMMRPHTGSGERGRDGQPPPEQWSVAARRRRFGREAERQRRREGQ
jgi:CRISPR-associated protein Cas2